MMRTPIIVMAFGTFLGTGFISNGAVAGTTQSPETPCAMADASHWIEAWFGAWDLTARKILHLSDSSAPDIVFYDSSCLYTTSGVTAGGLPPVDGPKLCGGTIPWRVLEHGGSMTLPDSSTAPIQLMSFTSAVPGGGPFFVMAAPSYWRELGHGEEPGLTAVFLHEFSHTRQVEGFRHILGPIDSTWHFPEELTDDAVQTHFEQDSTYVESYMAERDLLYRAADAQSLKEVRSLASDALAMMRARHARWFTGDNEVFAALDNVFLALEGVGQWTAYAWLAHPEGGGLSREAAISKMLGRRRWWAQDEGLALLLVVDRLLPDWPTLVFCVPSLGALELLDVALHRAGERGLGP